MISVVMSWISSIKIDFVDWRPSWCVWLSKYSQLEDEIRKKKIIIKEE